MAYLRTLNSLHRRMEWHPRGAVLLAGSEDGFACMWEVTHENGKYESRCLQVLAGHSAAVSCGGFAAGGRMIVTGCDDAKVGKPLVAGAVFVSLACWRFLHATYSHAKFVFLMLSTVIVVRYASSRQKTEGSFTVCTMRHISTAVL